MYNELVKCQFIDSLSNSGTKKYSKSLFGRTDENFESVLQKDIAEMDKEEILNGLQHIHYLSYASVRSDLTLIKKYAGWYNSHIKEIDIQSIQSITIQDMDLTESIQSEIFKNEEELRSSLSFLSVEDGYFEIPVLLLAWVGLDLKEILNLKNEDVIFKDDKVFLQIKNNVIPVRSSYIISVLKKYKRVKESVRHHRGDWIVYSDDIGYFIKNMVTMDSKFTGRRLTASNVRKKIDAYNRALPEEYKGVSFDRVLLSGRLYRVLQSEIANGTLLPEVVANEMSVNIKYVNDCIRLYNTYKKTFWSNKAE